MLSFVYNRYYIFIYISGNKNRTQFISSPAIEFRYQSAKYFQMCSYIF